MSPVCVRPTGHQVLCPPRWPTYSTHWANRCEPAEAHTHSFRSFPACLITQQPGPGSLSVDWEAPRTRSQSPTCSFPLPVVVLKCLGDQQPGLWASGSLWPQPKKAACEPVTGPPHPAQGHMLAMQFPWSSWAQGAKRWSEPPPFPSSAVAESLCLKDQVGLMWLWAPI